FQVLFAFQPRAQRAQGLGGLGGLAVQPLVVAHAAVQFDLHLTLSEGEDGLLGTLRYRSDLFEAATIARLASHYQRLLQAIVADPSQSVAELPLLTEGERTQLLLDWNATAVAYP